MQHVQVKHEEGQDSSLRCPSAHHHLQHTVPQFQKLLSVSQVCQDSADYGDVKLHCPETVTQSERLDGVIHTAEFKENDHDCGASFV